MGTMAATFVASAATGAGLELVFGTLLKVIFEVRKTNSQFEPTLKLLEATVNDLTPDIRKIDGFNREFDRPDEMADLKGLMLKAEQLVRKCEKIRRYNIPKRYFHAKKLIKLNDSIPRYIGGVMQIIQFADQKETLHEVKQLNNQVRKSLPRVVLGLCSPPELKVSPIGLETPLMELKGKLLRDELPLVVISAPRGCGKTTLATALCHDPKVRDKFKGNILFVTFGTNPSLVEIVERLHEHYNFQFPGELLTDEDAITELESLVRRIESDPVLLVIDDVWSRSESLLERLKFQIRNYQILVTSSFEFPRISSTYKMKPLSDEDALALFSDVAFSNDGCSFIPDQAVVSKIVKACKGYPKAIARTGSSLRGRPAAEWRKRAKESLESSDSSDLDSADSFESKAEGYQEGQGSFSEVTRNALEATLADMKIELHKLVEDDAIVDSHQVPRRISVDFPKISETSGHCFFDDQRFIVEQGLLRDLANIGNNQGSIDHQGNDFAV